MKRFLTIAMAAVIVLAVLIIPISARNSKQENNDTGAVSSIFYETQINSQEGLEQYDTITSSVVLPDEPPESGVSSSSSVTAEAPRPSAPGQGQGNQGVSSVFSEHPAVSSQPSVSQPKVSRPQNVSSAPQIPSSIPASSAGSLWPKPSSSRPVSSSKPSGNSNLTFAEKVVELVNDERQKAGLSPFSIDRAAERAALVRAKEIEISFAHTRPNGSSFSTALTEEGVKYRAAGENIAWGQRSPQEVVQGWMNSPGHRANILNQNYTSIGVGHYKNASGTNYWVQLFIG